MPQQEFIRFENVVKRFGKNVVLNGLDLDVPYGERFGIIGISGSGKTTLLNLLIGFLRPDSGKISYFLRDISKDSFNIKQTFGFATQQGSFYAMLNIVENLQYFGRLYGLKPDAIRKKADELLSLVDLSDAKHVLAGDLSKGMQRRLDIACALIHDPRVLILDEPTEDLDPMLRKEILQLIKRINEKGTTIIITSHLLEDMEFLCTKIAILHKGKIMDLGTTTQLKKKYNKNDEIHLETVPGHYARIAKALGKRDIARVECKEHKMVIHTPKPEKVLHNVLHSLGRLDEKLLDVTVNKPTLEEVFESATRK